MSVRRIHQLLYAGEALLALGAVVVVGLVFFETPPASIARGDERDPTAASSRPKLSLDRLAAAWGVPLRKEQAKKSEKKEPDGPPRDPDQDALERNVAVQQIMFPGAEVSWNDKDRGRAHTEVIQPGRELDLTTGEKVVFLRVIGLKVWFKFRNRKFVLVPVKGAVIRGDKGEYAIGRGREGAAGGRQPAAGWQQRGDNHWLLTPNLRNDLYQQRDKILSEVSPIPVPDPDSGVIKGLLLRTVGESTLAHQRGFREGDIVKQINGVDIKSLAQIRRMMQTQGGVRRVVIVAERSGRDVTFVFDIR